MMKALVAPSSATTSPNCLLVPMNGHYHDIYNENNIDTAAINHKLDGRRSVHALDGRVDVAVLVLVRESHFGQLGRSSKSLHKNGKEFQMCPRDVLHQSVNLIRPSQPRHGGVGSFAW